ncbi:MAG: ATP-binding cassette domain-containing protein [Rhodobacteraceae bacterium]|nr:ATP-binding cassette domain-containing protein [Paracoccaceae bacterium]
MIRIEGVTVQFGGVRPLNGLTAEFTDPICGLIGPNGAGKTTLLNVLSGFVAPICGRILLDDIDLSPLTPQGRFRAGLRRSFQTEQVVDDLNVWDNLMAAFDNLVGTTVPPAAQISKALHYTGLAARANTLGSALNLFERRMVEIGKALIGTPRAILLDEPGAGMNEGESAKLRKILLGISSSFGAQVLLIDHDVDLIQATCSQTLVLDFGEKLALGPTADVLRDKAVRNAYLGVA